MENNTSKNTRLDFIHPMHRPEVVAKVSAKLKGRVPWNKGKTNIYSNETIEKMRKSGKTKIFTPEHCKRISESLMGDKNPSKRLDVRLKKSKSAKRGPDSHLWKGGISTENNSIRGSLEYRLWRKAIFERDNYTCRWCGTKKSPFNAHHIKPFSLFPELRFAIDNGITLCHPCHEKTDSYGWKLYKQLNMRQSLIKLKEKDYDSKCNTDGVLLRNSWNNIRS